MPESVYKVIELVGSSTESWEKAGSRGPAFFGFRCDTVSGFWIRTDSCIKEFY